MTAHCLGQGPPHDRKPQLLTMASHPKMVPSRASLTRLVPIVGGAWLHAFGNVCICMRHSFVIAAVERTKTPQGWSRPWTESQQRSACARRAIEKRLSAFHIHDIWLAEQFVLQFVGFGKCILPESDWRLKGCRIIGASSTI